MRSRMKKTLVAFIYIGFLMFAFTLRVNAQENTEEEQLAELNQVMTIQEDCDARELPDQEATVVMHYSKGDSVWVVGETPDGWYKVSYQGKEGYIQKECITGLQIEVEGQGTVELEDTDLDGELAEAEAEGKMLVEELERQKAETRRSRIWGIVIVVLIVAIFATGIISVARKDKGSRPKNKK